MLIENPGWERSSPPDVLVKARVPEVVWTATCDAVDTFNLEFPIGRVLNTRYVGYCMVLSSFICIRMSILESRPDNDEGEDTSDSLFAFLGAALLVIGFCQIFSSFINRPRNVAWGRVLSTEVARYSSFGVIAHGPLSGRIRFEAVEAAPASRHHQRSVVDELEALQKLHEAEGLTDEEFTAAKSVVLERAAAKSDQAPGRIKTEAEWIV